VIGCAARKQNDGQRDQPSRTPEQSFTPPVDPSS
jgi:hypothetical protein